MNLCNYEIMQSVFSNFTPSPCPLPLKREEGKSSPFQGRACLPVGRDLGEG
jgi:hypothetical protein